jgi:hypothetical protein
MRWRFKRNRVVESIVVLPFLLASRMGERLAVAKLSQLENTSTKYRRRFRVNARANKQRNMGSSDVLPGKRVTDGWRRLLSCAVCIARP